MTGVGRGLGVTGVRAHKEVSGGSRTTSGCGWDCPFHSVLESEFELRKGACSERQEVEKWLMCVMV